MGHAVEAEGARFDSEKQLCKHLRRAIEGLAIGAGVPRSDARTSSLLDLERFIPATLANVFPVWSRESFDAIYLGGARIARPYTIELHGLALLVVSQSLVRFYAILEIAPDEDALISCEFGAGERDPITSEMLTHPFGSAAGARELLENETSPFPQRTGFVYRISSTE